MKYTRIAAALIASAISTSAFASNWVSVQTPMTAYVAAGLTASVTQELIFPDIVKPVDSAPVNTDSTAAESSAETVTVTPDGSVTYTGDSAPGGGAGSQVSENATGNTTLMVRSAQAGILAITGERGYSISVSISEDSTQTATPGMSFDAVFDNNGSPSTTTNAQIGADGTLNLGFGGALTVNSSFQLTPGQETTIQLTALINYRG